MTGKTLKELNAQPGDVVSFGNGPYTITKIDGGLFYAKDKHGAICGPLGDAVLWHIVSRAVDTPKLWRDMTPEEKGALLLAHHEGEVIEVQKTTGSIWYKATKPIWHSDYAHRIRPEPKVETVTIRWQPSGAAVYSSGNGYTHRITFNLIDGKPDCDSVKMEEL
jgi:hypothetical protein